MMVRADKLHKITNYLQILEKLYKKFIFIIKPLYNSKMIPNYLSYHLLVSI
jgi:hypothetical protein